VLYCDDRTGAIDISIDRNESVNSHVRISGSVSNEYRHDVERWRHGQRPVQEHGWRGVVDAEITQIQGLPLRSVLTDASVGRRGFPRQR
jgi:hypothetical protein